MITFKQFIAEDSNVDTTLFNLSKKSGIDMATLRKVFERGSGSHQREHRPGSSVGWGLARVQSFISGKGKAREADQDLWDNRKQK